MVQSMAFPPLRTSVCNRKARESVEYIVNKAVLVTLIAWLFLHQGACQDRSRMPRTNARTRGCKMEKTGDSI
jgi:hypothetical protein